VPEPVPLQPDEERFRLLDAVSQLLITIAARTPIVLVLDDLHWVDKGTLAMLRHVARFEPQHRLRRLGTYRDAEVDAQHPPYQVDPEGTGHTPSTACTSPARLPEDRPHLHLRAAARTGDALAALKEPSSPVHSPQGWGSNEPRSGKVHPCSNSDQLDMSFRRGRERFDVVRIRGNDVISVLREEHEGGVDHITASRVSEQLAGGPAERIVERPNVDAGKRLREQRLVRPPPPPRLTHDTAM